ncbi:ankyrin repeat domain-containing protein [Deinococcus cavernae]|uniref:Ankyrin repeat domain-containing protein n=1 Tax=Deinococcus cavernae TaxID=2320857 RepID=A0A418V7N1_9DEIO|nr:ankyrin repeat domain-containing protein [Deinococcus cavernae]RJF72095.1 ankyrin repeat domain-containing protein [Deinococcus cavernae]
MSDAATDLFAAIHAHNIEGVRLLIEAEPELLTASSPSGLSPVLFAAYYRRPAIVQLLIDAGAPLTLFEAAAAGQTAQVMEKLEADPQLLQAFSPDGFTALGLAAFFGHQELTTELLRRGADVHAASRNAMQVQPLHSAVAGNHLGTVRALLQAGADVNAVQQDGFTPLMGAVQNGNTDLVALLLSHGAAPDRRTADDRSAWTLAAQENHEGVLNLLRDAGAEPEENEYDSEGQAGSH